MSEPRKLTPPTHVIQTSYHVLAKKWFKETFCTEENRVYLHDWVNNSHFDDYVSYSIEAAMLSPKSGPLGYMRIYNNGEVMVFINPDYAYLFDDTEAVYRKMRQLDFTATIHET